MSVCINLFFFSDHHYLISYDLFILGDFEFATAYGIPIKEVIDPIASVPAKDVVKGTEVYCGEGVLINSGDFTGLTTQEAKKKITDWAAHHSCGGHQVNFKVRDWLVSRQR